MRKVYLFKPLNNHNEENLHHFAGSLFLPNSSIILIISFWHSFGCFFAYTPSGIMYIGYIMAAFPSKLAFIFAVQRLSIKLTNQIRLPRSSRQPFLTIGHFPKATIF
ncbi:hypothetical protein MOC33_20985, partial [Bacillus spizizenii]|nr:hypothetical protein [Bacillus spizizenii]